MSILTLCWGMTVAEAPGKRLVVLMAGERVGVIEQGDGEKLRLSYDIALARD